MLSIHLDMWENESVSIKKSKLLDDNIKFFYKINFNILTI